jgi:hypothetical protein
MDRVYIKYTIIFYCKTLQNLPKFGFLVGKQTIWQPWSEATNELEVNHSFIQEDDTFIASAHARRSSRNCQGCQIACFQTKNTNSGKF